MTVDHELFYTKEPRQSDTLTVMTSTVDATSPAQCWRTQIDQSSSAPSRKDDELEVIECWEGTTQ
jgi:hypothetical protein